MLATTKKKVQQKTAKAKYIYWCHTDLPEDYFFIYGSSALQVKRTYNNLGGFEGNDHIIVHRICEIPQSILKEMKIKGASDVAEDELVLKSGVEFLHKDGSAFRYEGNIYREAGIFDDKYDKDELRVYLFKEKEKLRYKVGHSKNVSRRLKELSKPDQLEILFTIPTESARKLEAEVKRCFKKFQVYNEYIEVDEWGSFLLQTIFLLYSTEFSKTDLKHIASEIFKSNLTELKEMVQNHKINATPARDLLEKGTTLHNLIEERSEKLHNERWQAYINDLTRS